MSASRGSFLRWTRTGQNAGQSWILRNCEGIRMMQRGLAKIGVHQQHFCPMLRQDGGAVYGGQGLAFRRHRAGDDHDLRRLGAGGKQKRGSQTAVGLSRIRLRPKLVNQAQAKCLLERKKALPARGG